ncbi:MAG: hypothetical protein V4683_04135 [Bacteroidota bacterium]
MNFTSIVTRFTNQTLPKIEWTHEAHLITCVWHLENYNELESICLLRARIISYNQSVGGENTTTGGYHETLTQFYVKIIDQFLRNLENPNLTFEEKCEKLLKSTLANREYPLEYYTKELLFSLPCRATWVEPDLKKLGNYN